MEAQELRDAFINFFKARGHTQIPSASLIPENDPTVLFTTAGMHPLVPYLLGQKHPAGTRLTDYQKCVRTGDIDEVGDASHLTFFEMLGNWSLGDYFKEDSVHWSYDLLQEVLHIPPEQLAVTCFAGDEDAPKDTETAELWEKEGIAKDHIFFLPKEDNWWGPAGMTGPCGPDTEIFFIDKTKEPCGPECQPGCHCGYYTEIWNNVFMEYFKDAEGNFTPLEQKNVDTGMGLERALRVINGVETVYDTPLFTPIISKVEEISGKTYQDDMKAFRVISDHMRAATFLISDGVVPARMGGGYILRRLIRRTSRYLSRLDVEGAHCAEIAQSVIDNYSSAYPDLKKNEELIKTTLTAEEEKFQKTIRKGMRRIEKLLASTPEGEYLDGAAVFQLYDTFGFPVELTKELAEEEGRKVDLGDFDGRFKKHQNASRSDEKGSFKGGLADNSEETTKLHTATHLLNAALRNVIDPEIMQKGSNITVQRLRFDFNFDRKLTPEELASIEKYVNDAIEADLPVVCEEMSLDEARAKNAIGVFDSKYGDNVKVYTIGDVSCEICGGPHVEHTGQLQGFKIKKEQSSAAGVRRIKAVVGKFD